MNIAFPFSGASCCVGWSIFCSIVLFLVAAVYYFEMPVGEYISKEEYRKLAWDNLLGGIIWVLAGAFSAFMYVRQLKKEEAAEQAAAEAAAAEDTTSSSSSTTITEVK